MYYQKRVCVLYCAIVAAASLLLARLFCLSIPESNRSLTVLEGQYTGRVDVCERTGFIYDRNGYVISHKADGFTALVNPAECTDVLGCAVSLSQVSVAAQMSEIYEKVIEGVPFTLSLTSELPKQVSGVYVFRKYEQNNDIAKHFLGYSNSDGNGMCGIRKAYDTLLGKELYSRVSARFDTNAKRESLSDFTVNTQKYLSDDGIVTTIDRDLQFFCDGLSQDIPSGAVVVADVKTGEILSLSSYPGYDVENIEQILDSEKGELLNRAAMSFTPGSVFKIVVAAAALEKDEGLYGLEYICDGNIEIDGNVFKCHKYDGHGKVDMKTAFAESCNTYFINLGREIGLEQIVGTAKKLELDVPTKADFVEEGTNYFIDENNASDGYLANISFGQGDLCLSPMDMIRVVGAVSTGYLTGLKTVKGQIKDGGFEIDVFGEKVRIFSKSTCKKLKEMMKMCVSAGTGTAGGIYGVNTGGKTATAQTGRFNGEGVEYVHKWFCGVYPIENPRISVCILCDDVTDENVSSAVVFAKICSYLYEKDL